MGDPALYRPCFASLGLINSPVAATPTREP